VPAFGFDPAHKRLALAHGAPSSLLSVLAARENLLAGPQAAPAIVERKADTNCPRSRGALHGHPRSPGRCHAPSTNKASRSGSGETPNPREPCGRGIAAQRGSDRGDAAALLRTGH